MIKQCAIILGCLTIGELIVSLTGIKLPASIIGMILLTVSLRAGWIKVQSVKEIADLLTKNLAFFFVPSGVAIMLYLKVIQASFWPIVISALGSTVIILMVTGWVHQVLRKKGASKVSTATTHD
ncbi:CidA/LrgA family protein [Chitinophagaceae bacterium LB-8]|uniref:CidA/LrgA family protein n=1 Tax=Paraflavisolibacter caeni TaxID=2982496 RepID=A0A9X3BGC1_9BACT|nr:CidA/LrgA family protein [Paraflavisolibacter caeni]MCU7547538.1 CidA/LrgA family protein [Paraflavisolibacter caeni]